mgnify:CR=1 FL=1
MINSGHKGKFNPNKKNESGGATWEPDRSKYNKTEKKCLPFCTVFPKHFSQNTAHFCKLYTKYPVIPVPEKQIFNTLDTVPSGDKEFFPDIDKL